MTYHYKYNFPALKLKFDFAFEAADDSPKEKARADGLDDTRRRKLDDINQYLVSQKVVNGSRSQIELAIDAFWNQEKVDPTKSKNDADGSVAWVVRMNFHVLTVALTED